MTSGAGPGGPTTPDEFMPGVGAWAGTLDAATLIIPDGLAVGALGPTPGAGLRRSPCRRTTPLLGEDSDDHVIANSPGKAVRTSRDRLSRGPRGRRPAALLPAGAGGLVGPGSVVEKFFHLPLEGRLLLGPLPGPGEEPADDPARTL